VAFWFTFNATRFRFEGGWGSEMVKGAAKGVMACGGQLNAFYGVGLFTGVDKSVWPRFSGCGIMLLSDDGRTWHTNIFSRPFGKVCLLGWGKLRL
jgi:hypothetical protein